MQVTIHIPDHILDQSKHPQAARNPSQDPSAGALADPISLTAFARQEACRGCARTHDMARPRLTAFSRLLDQIQTVLSLLVSSTALT
jgi:hypothetical protein